MQLGRLVKVYWLELLRAPSIVSAKSLMQQGPAVCIKTSMCRGLHSEMWTKVTTISNGTRFSATSFICLSNNERR